MTAAEALEAAVAAGVAIAVECNDLVLAAASMPPAEVLDALRRHKSNIIELLRPGSDGWSAKDWGAFFDERVAIAEFDGGLSHSDAEVEAFACCVVEWLNRHPVRSPPGRCLGCGGLEYGYDPLLPYGAEPTGHAWLHSRCWEAWYTTRKSGAVAALKAIGIGCRFSEAKCEERFERSAPSKAEGANALSVQTSGASSFECSDPSSETEPPLEQPCVARRGRMQQVGGIFLHFCVHCGALAPFGFGVSLRTGDVGQWYCARHSQEQQRHEQPTQLAAP
jgi:hypothetical protein